MAGITETYNINNTATMIVDIAYTATGMKVYDVVINNGKENKNLYSILPKNVASQVRKALDFLLNESGSISATTESGLTVYRGVGSDK